MDKNTIMICTQCGEFNIGSDNFVCKFCGGALANTSITTVETQHLSSEEFMKWRYDMLEKYSPGSEAFLKAKASKNSEKETNTSSYVPKCPTCGCPDISRIPSHQSSLDINNSVMAIVTNRTGKTFVCNNCGYTW